MFRRFVVATLVAVSVIGLSPVSSGHHYVAIQPGSERPWPRVVKPPPFDVGTPPCTYNFVFRDQKHRRYIGTAGHCTGHEITEVGQVMHIRDVGRIGTVAWKAPLPRDQRECGEQLRPEGVDPCVDFLLVRIDRALYGHIDPAVRHWGGPTGYLKADEIEAGLRMYHYGYGRGPHASEMSRPRAGVVLGMVPGGCGYRTAYPLSGSDSGSPQIVEDGRALGWMTTVEGDGALGMTVDCAIREARKAGYRLKLETAPLTDAVEREQARLSHDV
jgi:hypothetical protein